MAHRIRIAAVFLLALCLILSTIYPGTAQQATLLSALLLNGDFEGNYYVYGSGYVAEHWVPYDYHLGTSPPQYVRSTSYKYGGEASQQIWADTMAWYAGIMQTTVLTSEQAAARIQAGKRYVVHVWMHSVYEGAGSAVQDGRILKRVGIHPSGDSSPTSADVVWAPWHGQDKAWIQINAAVVATGNRLTIFIEAKNEESAGQDQLYIDSVWLEEEGAPPPTQTPTPTSVPTITPVPTSTPPVAVLRSVPVGQQPQGIGILAHSDRFFVANTGEGTVSGLEGFFHWQESRLPSGGQRPSGVAIVPEQCRMYVTNTGSDSVTVFSVCSNTQITAVRLGTGSAPDGIAAVTENNTIYVAQSGADSVAVIDGDALSVVRSIPTGPRPAQIAVNGTTDKVYVTNRGSVPSHIGTVTVIDANTQAVRKTIDLSAIDPLAEPGGIAVNPITNQVYVALASGYLVVIDGTTDELVRAVSPPTSSGLDAVAVNPSTNHVFASSMTGGLVFVYDANTQQWLYTLTVGAGQFRGIAVNPLTQHVVVSNPNDDTVSVIRDFGAYQTLHVFLPIVQKPR
jgi:YVTN family beta-propeller protein